MNCIQIFPFSHYFQLYNELVNRMVKQHSHDQEYIICCLIALLALLGVSFCQRKKFYFQIWYIFEIKCIRKERVKVLNSNRYSDFFHNLRCNE